MRNRVVILCATLLSLTGCTGQTEPVAASSGAASSSVVESSSVPDILVSNMVFDKCKGLSYESIRDFVDRLVGGREFRVTL